MSHIIDGRKRAEDLKKELCTLRIALEKETGIKPGLAVLRVGEDLSSQLYVQRKAFQAQEIGYHFEEHTFPFGISPDLLETKIRDLNQADHIHGMILQLPLPHPLDKFHLLSLIDPAKDVDGLHPINAGKLFQGIPGGFVPCTPLGCLSLIQTIHPLFEGLNVGVIGTSILVGRPMAMLMLQQKCTVWMAHSKTQNLPTLCETADILIVAIGKPSFIQGNWIRKGATIIDVGINRLPSGELVGDVDFASAQQRAGAITPVPGGAGPMTVAALLRNTLEAAYRHAGLIFPL